MAADTPDLIGSLSPLGQAIYSAALAVGLALYGVVQYVRNRSAEKAKPEEHFDAEELLDASPVRAFFENVARVAVSAEEIAANAKLQSEALRTISAVATLQGKRWEQDFDELRIFKAVQEALDRDHERRRAAAPPSAGWGN